MSTAEEMDRQVYDALKSQYETLMLRMVDRAIKGNDWQSDFDKLIETFNQRCDESLRMMQRLRGKETA